MRKDETGSTVVETYRFDPADLGRERRPMGISAFVRTRNGADFIESVIRSHIDHFDEIVVVHNQCTDGTPAIVARLREEFGADRIPTFDYRPEVFPPGSAEHVSEPADSPRSLVTYSNFALSRTRFAVALKLDDDHMANGPEVARVVARIRKEGIPRDEVWCFSGINIARDAERRAGVPAFEPVVGLGDHAYFPVDATTYFHHDPRFERFRTAGRRRVFVGILYWHLKYLKAGNGFANYGIDAGHNPRYGRKRAAFLANRGVMSVAELRAAAIAMQRKLWLALPMEKQRLRRGAWRAIAAGVVDDDNLELVLRSLGQTRDGAPPR